MKILLFGGSGILGKELKKINSKIICPTRYECNINDQLEVCAAIEKHSPDLIIHAAAITDNRGAENAPNQMLRTNIIGTANIAVACVEKGIRLVYISTDYVYNGEHGNCKETDPLQPFNFYSWTKLGGECSVIAVKNHLIIRTSFGKTEFSYIEAFVDKWSSKDYVDVIAPLIYDAALSPLTGVLNIGTERKTLFQYAQKRNCGVKPVRIIDTTFITPYDTSLNLQKWMDYKSSKSVIRLHGKCRVCGSHKLNKYLDLGLMPLANNLDFTAHRAIQTDKYPLQVMFCGDCGLSQLSVVIDPEKLFCFYTYRSSINEGYVRHCRAMAESFSERYGINENSFHIDVAGNDGALLNEFRKVLNHKVLNVDPASNLTAIAEANGIPSITDFWSEDLIPHIPEKANLITATNVFAHVDDVKGFMNTCRKALAQDGILVIENPYLLDFIENKEFDTVYFEHVTYWSVLPMINLCLNHGMKVIDAEKHPIHGGTMRYIIARDDSKHFQTDSVLDFCTKELTGGYHEFESYRSWSTSINGIIKSFQENLLSLKKQGNTIVGFAASAKGNTLLNSACINTDLIPYIVDQTPEKIGKYSPGTGIPIVGIEKIMKTRPDYILILSWNFKEEIIAKIKALGYKGRFIIPIPEWQIV